MVAEAEALPVAVVVAGGSHPRTTLPRHTARSCPRLAPYNHGCRPTGRNGMTIVAVPAASVSGKDDARRRSHGTRARKCFARRSES